MSENINLDEIRKLTEEVNSLVQSGMIPLNDNTKQVVDKFANLTSSLTKLSNPMDDYGKSLKKAVDALGDLTDASKDLIQVEKDLTEETAKMRSNAVKQFGKDLLTAGGSFMSAMNDVSQGTGKYAKSVEQLGLSASRLGSAFGKYGEAAGWAAEKLMQWAAASLRQNDVLNKSFEALSKYGQVDNSDLKKLMGEFHDLGLTVDGAAHYIEQMNKVSTELALLGSSASAGRKVFNETFQGMLGGETQEHLLRLGYTTQEIMEQSASYMANLAVSARGQKLDTNALHKSTVEYLETYAELTALTGKNRDELAKSRRTQEEDVAFQLYLSQLEKNGEKEKADQLRMMSDMMGTMGKEYQVGYQQYARTGSFSNPEAAKLLQIGGYDAMTGLRAGGNAKGTREERVDAAITAMNKFATGYNKSLDIYSGNLMYSRTGGMAGLGINAESYKGGQLWAGKNAEEMKKLRAEMLSLPEGSDRRKLLSDQINAERGLQQMTDKATYAMGDLTVSAVTSLAQAANWAADGLTRISDWTGATDNWNKPFKSLDKLSDVSDILTKEQKKQVDITKKINEANQEILDYDAEIKTLEEQSKQGGKIGADADKKLAKVREKRSEATEKKASATRSMQASEREEQRAVNAGTRIQQSGGDVLAGLNVYSKSGDTHMPGAYVDPRLVDLMHRIQKEVPGFSHFTSVNDRYHQGMQSEHNKGRAIDMVLSNPKPTNEELDKAVNALKGMGLKVLDEYRKPSSNATAPHLHASLQARTGGIFSGPNSGYQVELHGKEAVVPMNSVKSMFGSAYDPEGRVTKHSLSNPGSAVSSTIANADNGILKQLMSMLVGRLDDMIYELQSANSASAKIAKNTKKK